MSPFNFNGRVLVSSFFTVPFSPPSFQATQVQSLAVKLKSNSFAHIIPVKLKEGKETAFKRTMNLWPMRTYCQNPSLHLDVMSICPLASKLA